MAVTDDLYSVVITCYDYGRYLAAAIESVLSQDDENFEVIVVDDGSKDDTAAVARRYGDRIRFLRQSHSGPFAAARAGVLEAKGSRIVFVDADDRLRPQALRQLRATAASQAGAALVLGRICYSDEAGKRTVFEPPHTLSENSLANFVQFCRGELKAVIAGGLIDRDLLLAFDRDSNEFPTSMDLAVLGLGLLRGCVQSDFCTLDVISHQGRVRDNVNYVDTSDLQLVDVLFDEKLLPAEALAAKRDFVGFIERERARSYYRAGWHSAAWRAYLRAVRATPHSIRDLRHVRRFLVSAAFAAARKDEGPVARPPGRWPMGHRRAFFSDPIAFTFDAAQRYGKTVRLDLQRRTYLLSDRRDIRHVLSRNYLNYQPAGISRTAPAFADGLLGTRHPHHGPMRRWLTRYLDPRDIDDYRPAISEILDRRFAAIPSNTTLDIATIVRATHFEIASRIVLGCESADHIERLDHLILKSHNYSFRIARSFVRLPRWIPLRPQRAIKMSEDEIDEIFGDLVRSRKSNDPPSILGKMLADAGSGSERLPPDIRGNVVGLMLAACDPTTIPTYLSIFLCGKNPAHQERIADEIAAFSELSTPGAREHFDYRRMPSLNRFIDEVLRLYPSEWLLTRQANQSERLPTGLLIRRGNQVMVSIYNLHRNGEQYPHPDVFDPDRFAAAGTKPSGDYMPFGAGARACLGQPLSRLIISMSLVTFLSKWRVEPLSGEIRLSSPNCLSILPQRPVSVRLRERGSIRKS